MERPQILWVVGEPGVGKTTLVRALLAQLGPAIEWIDRPKWTLGDRWAAAGHYRGEAFDGADTIPIHDIKPALAYWATHLRDSELTVFDGDKFSNNNAVGAVMAACEETPVMDPDIRCLLLTDRADRVEARRVARGTTQDPKWVAGRATKSARFALGMPTERRLVLAQEAGPVSLEEQTDRVLTWLGIRASL